MREDEMVKDEVTKAKETLIDYCKRRDCKYCRFNFDDEDNYNEPRCSIRVPLMWEGLETKKDTKDIADELEEIIDRSDRFYNDEGNVLGITPHVSELIKRLIHEFRRLKQYEQKNEEEKKNGGERKGWGKYE